MDFCVKKLSPSAKLPTTSYESAGYDLYSNENVVIFPGRSALISTGIAASIPEGYFGKIFDRSSVALSGLVAVAGVIDNDYRGEWKIVLLNTTEAAFQISKGDKIAQAVFLEYGNFVVLEVDKLSNTDRGDKGFGSTGK